MRRAAWPVLAVTALLAVSPASPAVGSTHRRATAMQSLQAGVFAEINATRRHAGLTPLRISRALSASARQHSTEMSVRGYFSHSSADGTSFDRRIARFYPMGHFNYWSVGENLLWSSPDVDAASALNMWMNSPEHRANILAARWRQIGVSAVHVAAAPGVYGNAPVTIITTDFGVRR